MSSDFRPYDTPDDYPLRRSNRQSFGNEEWDENLDHPVHSIHRCPCGRAHHLLQRSQQYHSPQESCFTDVHLFKDRFEVKLDLHLFHPEEVEVTTVKNYIIVEGEHAEDRPHGSIINGSIVNSGSIPRTFKLQYFLPDHVKWENIFCNLSTDDILTITVRRVEARNDADGKSALPNPVRIRKTHM